MPKGSKGKATKDDVIKARVTKELKKYYKQVAKDNDMDLSEMILKATEQLVERLEFKRVHNTTLKNRAEATEDKISKLRFKLKNRKKY